MLVLVLIVQVATLDEAINGAGVVEDAGVGEEAVHHGVQHVGGEQAVGAGVVRAAGGAVHAERRRDVLQAAADAAAAAAELGEVLHVEHRRPEYLADLRHEPFQGARQRPAAGEHLDEVGEVVGARERRPRQAAAGELGAAERAGEVAVVDAVAAEGGEVDAVRGEHGDRAPRVRVAAGVEAGEVELPRDGAPAGGARQGEAELEQVELVDVALHDGVALPWRAEVARRGDVVHRAGELRVHGHDGVGRQERPDAAHLLLQVRRPHVPHLHLVGGGGGGGGGRPRREAGGVGVELRPGGDDLRRRRHVHEAQSRLDGGDREERERRRRREHDRADVAGEHRHGWSRWWW